MSCPHHTPYPRRHPQQRSPRRHTPTGKPTPRQPRRLGFWQGPLLQQRRAETPLSKRQIWPGVSHRTVRARRHTALRFVFPRSTMRVGKGITGLPHPEGVAGDGSECGVGMAPRCKSVSVTVCLPSERAYQCSASGQAFGSLNATQERQQHEGGLLMKPIVDSSRSRPAQCWFLMLWFESFLRKVKVRMNPGEPVIVGDQELFQPSLRIRTALNGREHQTPQHGATCSPRLRSRATDAGSQPHTRATRSDRRWGLADAPGAVMCDGRQ